ncbi:hypothetical protein D1007_34113 [Hordeum vulgare]|uniref:Uncharacterized protein n=1 Tax=Hordeum vulgare subsp. vulgare TaxID=112509 RepID=A0A8I7BEH4_HORVV|nr:synaptonemal complex protein 1-like isoform X1 [Hordeum vulgare subsp. vulgare]KAE8791473.1 hypothetical protein D1007_34113 [Hordeum vulgare]
MPRSAISLRVPSRRRFLKTPIAPSSVNYSSAASGRPGGPCTPKLRWSFRESQEGVSEQKAPIASSVRRLGAAVWRLRPSEEAPAVERQGKSRVDLEFIPRHLQVQLLRKHHLGHKHGLKVETSSPNSVLEQHSEELHKVQLHLAPALMPITTLENATKWESESVKGDELDGAYVIANQLDLIEKQQGQTHANILHMELQRAQDRVDKLEAERSSAKKQLDRLSAKKQLDRLLEKLREEKAAWWRREHKKAQSVLEDMKADLDHEKKNRRQLENINLKLIDELKEVKLAANNLLEEYDKERKMREMTEEVCNKLAREVEEQKSDIEVLERNFVKLRGEVDEDRKLLQMAEVWREERVQMKLVDARLTLEDKYGELCKLQQDAEAFVASLGCAKGDISILVGEAENIIREIGLVRDQEIQFKYETPAASEEILAIFEELLPSHELGRCKAQRADIWLENPTNRNPCQDSEIEDGNSWETTSHQDVQGSSFSWNGNGSEPSVNNVVCDGISWTSGDDSEEVWQNDMSNIKVVEHKKKQSAISKFWGHCPRKNHGIQEVEVENSLNRGNMYYYSGEAANRGMGQSSPSMEPWSSPDSMNCGFRGCMELVQRHSLKAKLLEARMESQKIKLRRVLNQTT